jgi:hypothetical protein
MGTAYVAQKRGGGESLLLFGFRQPVKQSCCSKPGIIKKAVGCFYIPRFSRSFAPRKQKRMVIPSNWAGSRLRPEQRFLRIAESYQRSCLHSKGTSYQLGKPMLTGG